MPALPSVAKVIRSDLHFTVGEDAAAKCRYFHEYAGSAPTPSDLNTLATDTGVAFDTFLKALTPVGSALDEVIITDLTTPTAAIGSDATAVNGTNPGTRMEASACVLLSLEVLRRYRGGHPRIYWPFGTASDLGDQQQWSGAFVTNCQGRLNSYFADVVGSVWAGGGSLTPVNVSYYQGFTPHIGVTGRYRNVANVRPAPVVDVIVSTLVRAGVASQRKRLLRLA